MGTFGFLDIGTPELLLILLIVLLLFGGRKLPELSRSIGTSMRELRKGISDSGDEHKKSEDTSKQQPTP
ncbi:MAG TPA: twin-arginine translocase TatA/TatE family subunit [Candidatus Saccharimonadales bacterium]|nr:twin-arginine translocase TatA/TatE family subunit [Candidatus Saccharimonadales bacterium]